MVIKHKWLKYFPKKENKIEKLKSEERAKTTMQLQEVCEQIRQTDAWFQMESDSDMIEACIHQREMLAAKYRYLLGKIKIQKIS